jgi:hypothetical protein
MFEMAWTRFLRCSVGRDSLLNMPLGLTSVSCADAAEGSPSAKIISNDVATAVGLQSARLPQFKRLRAMTAQGRFLPVGQRAEENALIPGRAFRGEFRRVEDRPEAPENMICGPIRLSSNRGLVSICTIGPVVDRVMGLIRSSDRRPLFTDRAYKRHSSPALSTVSIKSKSPSISTGTTTGASSNIPRFASDAARATRSFCSASARVSAVTRIDASSVA